MILRVLGVLFGLLLAPGLCSLAFIGTYGLEYVLAPTGRRGQDLGAMIPLAVVWIVCIAIGVVGLGMIRRGFSGKPIDTPEGSADRNATRPRLIVQVLGWSILAFLAAGFIAGLFQGILR